MIGTPRHECVTQHALESVKAYLESGGMATALVTLTDEMALAVLSACRACGKAVPESVSMVNSGDSAMMGLAYPPITCIDVHLEAHIAQAMGFLDAATKDMSNSFDYLRLIEPHFVERESVAAPAVAAV